MASRPDLLAYLRITHVGTTAKGYLQEVYADNNAAGYSTARLDITGTSTGGTVMLKINSFLGQGTHEFDGEYRSGKLYLSYPTLNGQVAKLTFAPASIDAWNAAVGRFERQRTDIQQQQIMHAAVERQRWHDQLARAQTIQAFTRAIQTLNAAAPELIKSEENTDRAQATVVTTEAAYAAALHAHEDARLVCESKKQHLDDTRDQRTQAENVREYGVLQREYNQLQALHNSASAASDKRTNATQLLRDAQKFYDRTWETLMQGAQQLLQARRDIGSTRPTPIEFHTVPGLNAIPVSINVKTFRRFTDGHSAPLTTLPQNALLVLLVADGDWYGLELDHKRLAWVRASDVQVMDNLARPTPRRDNVQPSTTDRRHGPHTQ